MSEPGDYPISVTAENRAGKTGRTVIIRAGSQICLTPPLAWNSWYNFSEAVSDKKIRAVADAFVRSGLSDYGWAYINIQPEICVNFVFDLNGTKGPNTVGKDIGTMTALYASDSVVVAPRLRITNQKGSERGDAVCRTEGDNYRYIDADNGYSVWMNKLLWGIEGTFYTSTKILQGDVLKRKAIEARGTVWANENGNSAAPIYCLER